MNKKLFVGNLSYNLREEDLREAFSEFGEIVDIYMPVHRDSNKMRGFAFVEYKTEEAAKKAMEEMHEKELDGRAIVVNEARERS